MSFFDMDAELFPYEQVETPNTLIAYHQRHEDESVQNSCPSFTR